MQSDPKIGPVHEPLMVCLHYGKNHIKLVCFREYNKNIHILKRH
jgi:hypothetical protein